MRCPQCASEMRKDGEAMRCDRCGYLIEKNGLIEADRPEENE